MPDHPPVAFYTSLETIRKAIDKGTPVQVMLYPTPAFAFAMCDGEVVELTPTGYVPMHAELTVEPITREKLGI